MANPRKHTVPVSLLLLLFAAPSSPQPGSANVATPPIVYVSVAPFQQAQPNLFRRFQSELSGASLPESFLATALARAPDSKIGVFSFSAEAPPGYELPLELVKPLVTWPAGPVTAKIVLYANAASTPIRKLDGVITLVQQPPEEHFQGRLTESSEWVEAAVGGPKDQLVDLLRDVPILTDVKVNPSTERLSTNRTYESLQLAGGIPRAIFQVHNDASPGQDAMFVAPCGGGPVGGPLTGRPD